MVHAFRTMAWFFVFLLSWSAEAAPTDFSGEWQGPGQIIMSNIYTGNKTYPCSQINLSIKQSPTELMVRRYEAKCQMAGSDWGPYSFELRGEKVFEDGEETGSLIGDTFKSLQSSSGTQYVFNLRLKSVTRPEDKVLETYYGTRNMMGAMVIEGNLKAK